MAGKFADALGARSWSLAAARFVAKPAADRAAAVADGAATATRDNLTDNMTEEHTA